MPQLETKVKKCYESAPFPDSLRNAIDFDKELERITRWIKLNLEFLSPKLFDNSPKSVLCAGCGTGEEAIALAKIFPKSKIDAIDISTPSLIIARQNNKLAKTKNITFKKLSIIEELPKLRKKYDLVYSAGVIHHLSNPREGFEILTDKIKKNGNIVVMLYNSYGLFLYKLQLFFLDKIAGNNKKSRLEWVSLLNLDRGHDKAYVYDTYVNPQVQTYTIEQILTWGREENLIPIGIVPPLSVNRIVRYATSGRDYIYRRKGLTSVALRLALLIFGENIANKNHKLSTNKTRTLIFQLIYLILGRGECQYLFNNKK